MPGLLVDLSIIKQEKAYKRAHHQVHKTPPRPTKVYRRYKDPHFEKAPDYSPESKSCGSFLSAMPTRPHRLPALTPQAGQPDVDRWIRTSDSYGNRYQMHASPSQSSDSRLSANYGMPMAPVAMMQLPQMPQYPGLPGRDALGAVDLARERRGPPAQPPPAMQAPRGGGRPRGVERPPQAADFGRPPPQRYQQAAADPFVASPYLALPPAAAIGVRDYAGEADGRWQQAPSGFGARPPTPPRPRQQQVQPRQHQVGHGRRAGAEAMPTPPMDAPSPEVRQRQRAAQIAAMMEEQKLLEAQQRLLSDPNAFDRNLAALNRRGAKGGQAAALMTAGYN